MQCQTLDHKASKAMIINVTKWAGMHGVMTGIFFLKTINKFLIIILMIMIISL